MAQVLLLSRQCCCCCSGQHLEWQRWQRHCSGSHCRQLPAAAGKITGLLWIAGTTPLARGPIAEAAGGRLEPGGRPLRTWCLTDRVNAVMKCALSDVMEARSDLLYGAPQTHTPPPSSTPCSTWRPAASPDRGSNGSSRLPGSYTLQTRSTACSQQRQPTPGWLASGRRDYGASAGLTWSCSGCNRRSAIENLAISLTFGSCRIAGCRLQA